MEANTLTNRQVGSCIQLGPCWGTAFTGPCSWHGASWGAPYLQQQPSAVLLLLVCSEADTLLAQI